MLPRRMSNQEAPRWLHVIKGMRDLPDVCIQSNSPCLLRPYDLSFTQVSSSGTLSTVDGHRGCPDRQTWSAFKFTAALELVRLPVPTQFRELQLVAIQTSQRIAVEHPACCRPSRVVCTEFETKAPGGLYNYAVHQHTVVNSPHLDGVAR